MKLGNIVILTSIKEQTGKTFVIRNLAGTLAEEGKKVLIIDFSKNNSDYIDFFEFKKYSDLSKVYQKELSLQTVKLIYPQNRGISLIVNQDDKVFDDKFIEEFLTKIKKTYDYIFIEVPSKIKNKNLYKITQYANQNIILIEQELSSIKEINKIIKTYKHIKNTSILLNKFNYSTNEQSGILMELEDLFEIIDTKFLGVIEKIKKTETISQPSFMMPHTNFHLSLKRISKRIIKNKYLEKISNINLKNNFSMEILYKKFDIIEKKSF